MTVTLDDYLEEIKRRGIAEHPSINCSYSPVNLSLRRTDYLLYKGHIVIGNVSKSGDYYDPKLREQDKKSTAKDIDKAREKRRKDLSSVFEKLIQDPMNIVSLMDYSIQLFNDGYYEKSEQLLGLIISIHLVNPHVYHLLSQINLTFGRLSKKKKGLSKKFFERAEQLAERGLQNIDEISAKLVEDKINARDYLNKSRENLGSKLYITFSKKYEGSI